MYQRGLDHRYADTVAPMKHITAHATAGFTKTCHAGQIDGASPAAAASGAVLLDVFSAIMPRRIRVPRERRKDPDEIIKHSKLVVDTRNATRCVDEGRGRIVKA